MDRDLHRAHADLDESHWWFVARRRIIERTLRVHGPRAPSAVLDVGCGAGGLISMLSQFGSVTALEADAAAAATAQTRHPGAAVLHGSLPDAIPDLPTAQLVTAFDVIEHLDDDVGVLQRLLGHIEPGGWLCVTVPALPWLWSAHDDANGHRRRYTRASLRRALENAGFEVRHISYFNTVLFPLVAAARVAQRLLVGGGDAGDFDRTLGRVDRVLEALFGLERFIVPRMALPVGVSLIACATPR